MEKIMAIAKKTVLSTLCFLLSLWSIASIAYESTEQKPSEECSEIRQFTFSWSMHSDCKGLLPRGGTSKGAPVTLDSEPHQGWLAIQEKNISQFERDRRAILAMAGPYRTSFDFLEVIGFAMPYKPERPYQSWGTEYVYVIEDTGSFISLQHIMVMYFEKDGEISDPVVMKHWRQDWQYEKRGLHVYAGHNTWKQRKLPRKAVKGTWSQAVYQVDDSPRYEAIGKWNHYKNFSTWQSEKTWRPLPRREYSVRNDYHVLEGTNRHTILPNGWVHEQENYKVILDKEGNISTETPYLAKELGLNRYEKIVGLDFTPGEDYWQKTSAYWQDVRKVWKELMSESKTFRLNKKVDGIPLFMPMFEYAEKSKSAPYDSAKGTNDIRNIIKKYIVEPPK